MAETDETRAPSPRELKALIEAERTGLPFLHWRDGAGQQQILILGADRARVTIGRREQSDVALTWDTEVSRAHAYLEPVGGEWTLVDDGLSRNGSFVHGNRIQGRHRLHNRDQICFGKTHVTYREPGSDHGSVSTARAVDSPGAVPLTQMDRKVLVALCRPRVEAGSPIPATNPQIAAEVFLSVEAVKARLRILFDRFGVGALPQNEKRGRLVEIVLSAGVLAPHDF
ncbi:MAG TPA: FHA domain-containing protein [Solirubrobacteraceae bacterium]